MLCDIKVLNIAVLFLEVKRVFLLLSIASLLSRRCFKLLYLLNNFNLISLIYLRQKCNRFNKNYF